MVNLSPQAGHECRHAGFRNILFRGDTDFSQTKHLDRWDAAGARFIFGIDAMSNLKHQADSIAFATVLVYSTCPSDATRSTGFGFSAGNFARLAASSSACLRSVISSPIDW